MKGLRWNTAGESHGKALVGILEGMPAGLALDLARVDGELARRQGGYGRGGRMRIETDKAELLSGVRAGLTLGSPLALLVPNRDQTIERLPVPDNPRPGHADLAGCQRLGVPDPRAVLERASARETTMRVALGALARQLLEALGVELFAHVVELGGISARPEIWAETAGKRHELRTASDFYGLDASCADAWRARVDAARQASDTLGGVFEVRVSGLPPGLGGYANPSERLGARLGGALFSIPAMKGVEFGLGFETARRPGSQAHDAIVARDEAPHSGSARWGRFARATNRSGGLEGGMTTGEELVVRVAMKPIPTLRAGLPSLTFGSGSPVQATYQRSDVTSVPAASVVGEAVLALELAAALLERFPAASLAELRDGLGRWADSIRDL